MLRDMLGQMQNMRWSVAIAVVVVTVTLSQSGCFFDPFAIDVNVGYTSGDGDGDGNDALPITFATSDNIDDIDALINVEGHLHIDATDIIELNMFDLVNVEGDFIVRNNPTLTVMNLSDLRRWAWAKPRW